MPTFAAAVRFDNDSLLSVEAVDSAFLSAEFENDGQLAALLGAQWEALSVSVTNDGDFVLSARMVYAGAVAFDNDSLFTAVAVGWPIFVHQADVAFGADDAELAVDLRRHAVGFVVFFADSDLLVSFAPAIPVVRYPEAGETWGTVNLARNPSLEYDAVGLTDWSAGAGIDLDRTNTGEAWAGTYFGRAVIAPASGTPQLIVVSQDGLQQSGYGRNWVISAALRGDADTVTMWPELVYSDATTTIGDVVTIDATSDVPLSATTWWRYSTEVVAQDPTKALNRLDLVFAIPSHATLDLMLDVDAVQPEEALSGGPTPYADGDQGAGHYWVGTPGFSISVRETA